MLTACNAFVAAMEKWLHAWTSQDYERAKFLAEELPYAGSLLAIRPEFTAALSKRSNTQPPDALKIFSAFLQSLSESCGEAARNKHTNTKTNKPDRDHP